MKTLSQSWRVKIKWASFNPAKGARKSSFLDLALEFFSVCNLILRRRRRKESHWFEKGLDLRQKNKKTKKNKFNLAGIFWCGNIEIFEELHQKLFWGTEMTIGEDVGRNEFNGWIADDKKKK